MCLSLVITISLSKFISLKLNNCEIFSYKSSIPSFFNADIFTTFLKFEINSVSLSTRVFKSILFKIIIVFCGSTISKISISSVSSFLLLSIITMHKSASFAIFFDFSIPIFSTSFSVFLIPAVSINFKGIPFIFTNSSMVSLVVPSISVTIALSSFRMAFNKDDPTFGLPIIAVFIPSFIILPLSKDFNNFSSSAFICINFSFISLSSISSTSYSG